MKSASLQTKRMGATNVGVRRAHSYLWSLSSPQQPLRRRIHQPSLLPHNITRKMHAPQEFAPERFEYGELSNVTQKPRQLDLRPQPAVHETNVILSCDWVKTLLVRIVAS